MKMVGNVLEGWDNLIDRLNQSNLKNEKGHIKNYTKTSG